MEPDRRERIKAWVTKYALTDGVELVNAEVCHGISSAMISYGKGMQTAHGKDWHRDKASALKRAEEMRTAKIASLKKSIAKLEIMAFEVPQ